MYTVLEVRISDSTERRTMYNCITAMYTVLAVGTMYTAVLEVGISRPTRKHSKIFKLLQLNMTAV